MELTDPYRSSRPCTVRAETIHHAESRSLSEIALPSVASWLVLADFMNLNIPLGIVAVFGHDRFRLNREPRVRVQ